ncbi:transcription factor MafK-like [Exaiptasia diaphana]|uniref:BZIP domain-containing protein n=1 Tax=Exaiptasia diaphana TaxID=2652724 RepID=A0A913X293_EXADI|nr:transcription factor MafK-like [Exaiptasia diaphana]
MDLNVNMEEIDVSNDPFIADPQNVDFSVQDFTCLQNDAWLDNYVGLETQIQTSIENDTTSSKKINQELNLSKKKLPISDDDLESMSVRDLNQKIRHLELTKPQIQAIRKRRRSLKNRGYALSCRHRRVTENEELSKENEKLNKELKKLRDELTRTLKERDSFKKKYEKVSNYFNTMTASALSFSAKGGGLSIKG